MSQDQHYESWRKARTTVDVPDEFADRAMARVKAYRQRQHAVAATVYFNAVLASKWGRIAVCSAAGAACAVRVGSMLSLFIPG